jgi:hypothetical protein
MRSTPVCGIVTTLALLTLACGGTVGGSNPANTGSPLFVRGVIDPSYGSCTYSNDPMQHLLPSGTLDLALKHQYDAEYLVGSRVSDPGVSVQSVRVAKSDGTQLATLQRQLASGALSQASDGLWYGPVGINIVDSTLLASDPDTQRIATAPLGDPSRIQLLTYVRFSGRPSDGSIAESDEYEFPIAVCNGCLIAFTDDPRYPAPNCVGGPPNGGPMVPCFVGQDHTVSCGACQGVPSCHGVAADAGAD